MSRVLRAYLKQFEGSVTGWLSRYRSDPFFRTEINVVSLQVAFAVILLSLVGSSFSLLYHNISTAIVEGIRGGVGTHTPAELAHTIVEQIQQDRAQNLVLITSVVVVTTAIFSYIISRVTLAPARNALETQKQFIGNIAHELRTPLSIIKTNTEVALLEGMDDGSLRETLDNTIEELDRISDIINNLLSLSALTKPERVEFSAVDLSHIVDDVVEKFAPFAQRTGLQVTVRKSPDAVVWGNPTALQQIVGNLFKNAIQYTPRNGRISITVEPVANRQVEMIVQDTGMGIARKDLFRIFEPFYRSDPSRTRSSANSGLGLTIVSELVKMHRGKIALRSAIGRGTTVSIFLPGISGHGVVGTEMATKEDLNEIAVDFSHK